ncbi:hypothetical protein [Nonomuraea guangzhouensis]|uniref:Uncharacterized protein n=1 Tax=Nonomuraea guangzhouensis TaxID=1291555 RepID=A0ABW4GWF8_9ACTN|nr:hypothetical protein [Nonomuraea guangzhouensis]
MIVEPVVRVILRCSRCDTPWLDDEEAVALWVDAAQIEKAFSKLGGGDFYGWRRAGDLYLCEDCHIVDGGVVVERPPLRPVEQATVLRAQDGYARLVGRVAAYELLPSAPEAAR